MIKEELPIMKRYLLPAALLFALLLCSAPAWSQAPHQGPDPIAHALLAPDIIMKYHNDIGLDETQSAAIKDMVAKAQAKFLDIQWEMQGEQQKLIKLLNARPTDETAVLAQVDRVLDLERQVKKAQVSLMVRIKNTLTAAQLEKLGQLMQK
jgi:Spy/CpxP family protein refolding chaperone